MIYMGRASRIVRHHKGKKKAVAINLVAMIDMLTVLVFFLLVYSSEQVAVVPDSKDVQLPQSIAETRDRNTVVVIVGEQEIIVHGKPVAQHRGDHRGRRSDHLGACKRSSKPTRPTC